MSGALYDPPIRNPLVHQQFEVPVKIVQTGNAFSKTTQFGDVFRAQPHHGQPKGLNRARFGADCYFNPRDVAIGKIVVEILGFLDGVQESNSSNTDTLSFLVLHNADQLLGVEDPYPVEDLIISP